MLSVLISFCSRLPQLEREWKIGGPIGKGCHIEQNGNNLKLVNENGNESRCVIKDKATVIATDWEGGLTGTLKDEGKRISWNNGSWWLKAD
ncbi:MAG: hypothetical protein EXS36_07840 [Pedosphaera sp.]|nr:hypothetical protein [Pedosphaera sp.]